MKKNCAIALAFRATFRAHIAFGLARYSLVVFSNRNPNVDTTTEYTGVFGPNECNTLIIERTSAAQRRNPPGNCKIRKNVIYWNFSADKELVQWIVENFITSNFNRSFGQQKVEM